MSAIASAARASVTRVVINGHVPEVGSGYGTSEATARGLKDYSSAGRTGAVVQGHPRELGDLVLQLAGWQCNR